MHTLLLADDSVTIQRVIELTFADEDIEVVAVSDGDQAIDRLESSPPDIVLADIGMPGRDGYEVARYVRQSPKLAHIPVVLLTGAFEPVDQAKAAEVDCDGVLAKPFEPQLVIGRVKELLASTVRKKRQAEAAAAPPPASPVSFPAPPFNAAAALSATEPLASGSGTPAAPADLDAYFDRLDDAFATLPGSQPAKTEPAEPVEPPLTANAGMSVADQIDWYAAQQSPAAPEVEKPPVFALPQPTAPPVPPAFPVARVPAATPQPSAPVSPASMAPPPVVTPPTASTPGAAPPTLVAAAPAVSPAPVRDVVPEPVAAATVVVPPPAFVPPPPLASTPPSTPAVVSIPAVVSTPAVASSPAVAPVAAKPASVVEPVPASAPAPTAAPRALPSVADAFAAILAAEQAEAGTSARPVWPVATPAASTASATVSEATIEQIVERVLTRLSHQAVRERVTEVAERMVREEIERIKSSIRD